MLGESMRGSETGIVVSSANDVERSPRHTVPARSHSENHAWLTPEMFVKETSTTCRSTRPVDGVTVTAGIGGGGIDASNASGTETTSTGWTLTRSTHTVGAQSCPATWRDTATEVDTAPCASVCAS